MVMIVGALAARTLGWWRPIKPMLSQSPALATLSLEGVIWMLQMRGTKLLSLLR